MTAKKNNTESSNSWLPSKSHPDSCNSDLGALSIASLTEIFSVQVHFDTQKSLCLGENHTGRETTRKKATGNWWLALCFCTATWLFNVSITFSFMWLEPFQVVEHWIIGLEGSLEVFSPTLCSSQESLYHPNQRDVQIFLKIFFFNFSIFY